MSHDALFVLESLALARRNKTKKSTKASARFTTQRLPTRWRERLPWLVTGTLAALLFCLAKYFESQGSPLKTATEFACAVGFLMFALTLVAYVRFARCPECKQWLTRAGRSAPFRCEQCKIDWVVGKNTQA